MTESSHGRERGRAVSNDWRKAASRDASSAGAPVWKYPIPATPAAPVAPMSATCSRPTPPIASTGNVTACTTAKKSIDAERLVSRALRGRWKHRAEHQVVDSAGLGHQPGLGNAMHRASDQQRWSHQGTGPLGGNRIGTQMNAGGPRRQRDIDTVVHNQGGVRVVHGLQALHDHREEATARRGRAPAPESGRRRRGPLPEPSPGAAAAARPRSPPTGADRSRSRVRDALKGAS